MHSNDAVGLSVRTTPCSLISRLTSSSTTAWGSTRRASSRLAPSDGPTLARRFQLRGDGRRHGIVVRDYFNTKPTPGTYLAARHNIGANTSSATFDNPFLAFSPPTRRARYTPVTSTRSNGRIVPNLVVVKVGAQGKVSLYNHDGAAHVTADVAGRFTSD